MNLPIAHTDSTITARDFFAGQMAAAFIIAPKQPGIVRPDATALAKMAYEHADALIKERAK